MKTISIPLPNSDVIIIKKCLISFHISILVTTFYLFQQAEGEKLEYRVWNPFRSKLAAAILGGVDVIHMAPGSRVLYLGAASGTTVSHVADIVGPVNIYIYIHT